MFKIKDGFQLTTNFEPTGVFTDPRDGHEYPYATIGSQTWMLTNIDYGTRVDVPTNVTGSQWTQEEGTCYKYKNVDNYGDWTDGSRGGFYLYSSLSWVCPDGWHVPTKAEYDILTNYVAETYGSSSTTGMPMGALMSTTHWYLPTYAKTDAYGFNLLPTGQCYIRTNSTGVNWDKSETNDTTARIWVADDFGTSNVSFVEVGSNTWQNFPMSEWTPSTGFTLALPVRLVKDVAIESKGPEIDKIVVEISDDPSDNNLPTEKATKTYVDNAIPPTCQENYPFIITNKKDSMTNDARKIFLMKIISQETTTRTKFGFYHVSGNSGGIIMGIYNKLGELIAQTGQVDCSTAGNEEMLWFDAQNSFDMENGEEYWLAFLPTWPTGIYDNNIAPAQYETTTTTTADILSLTTLYTDNTTLPSTKPSGNYSTTVVYMAVK